MRLNRLQILAVILLCAIVAASGQEKQLTLDLLFTPKSPFRGKWFPSDKWMKDGRSYIAMEYDSVSKAMNIMKTDAATGEKKLFVDGSQFKLPGSDTPIRYMSFLLSADEKKIMLTAAPPQKQYFSRLTPAGNLYLFDVETRSFAQVTDVAVEQYNQKFSPDGTTISFVRDNNIYIYNIGSGATTQVTNDGTEDVINGKFDWVYEEEFGISDGYRWSPQGTEIAFWRFDQSRIPEFTMINYATLRNDVMKMKYPKAGDPNSTVKLGIYSLKSKQTTWIDLGSNDDMYVPRMDWSNEASTLFIQRLNRLQNKLELLSFSLATGELKNLFTEEDTTWVEVHDNLIFVSEPKGFLWTSERSGFNHVYFYDMAAKKPRALTSGSWDVDAITGVDEKKGVVYFTGARDTPLERQLYSVRFNGRDLKQLTPEGSSHTAKASPGANYFIVTSSTVSKPRSWTLIDGSGKTVRLLEPNEIPALREYALGTWEFFTVPTSDGLTLKGMMLKPPGFDPTKKYPVLMYVYGGPGSQLVSNSWGGYWMWFQLLAQKGCIIAAVDNRGTGMRGKAFKSAVYKNLGYWETNDQIEAAKFIASLSYVDAHRIGIWGWSYGGYMASMAILKGADVFRSAIAVAAVTDWKFYDTIYTERYMQRPSDNPEGYREASPSTHASKLTGNFLIVHGTTDDNVHWTNSLHLADALVRNNKQFRSMYYVNRNHGIGGGTTTLHLFTMMTDFLDETLINPR